MLDRLYKDLNLLTFVESLVLFISPSARGLSHHLGSCEVFLVAPYLQGWLGILFAHSAAELHAMARSKRAAPMFSFARCSSHLTWSTWHRAFLRTKLLGERRFIPCIRVYNGLIVLVSINLLAGVLVGDVGGAIVGSLGAVLVVLGHGALSVCPAIELPFIFECERAGVV